MILKEAWNKRNKLQAEGDKLYAKGDKLYAEGNKLCVEGNELCAEGNILYINEVIAFFGPKAVIDWETGNVEGKPLPIPAAELRGGN